MPSVVGRGRAGQPRWASPVRVTSSNLCSTWRHSLPRGLCATWRQACASCPPCTIRCAEADNVLRSSRTRSSRARQGVARGPEPGAGGLTRGVHLLALIQCLLHMRPGRQPGLRHQGKAYATRRRRAGGRRGQRAAFSPPSWLRTLHGRRPRRACPAGNAWRSGLLCPALLGVHALRAHECMPAQSSGGAMQRWPPGSSPVNWNPLGPTPL